MSVDVKVTQRQIKLNGTDRQLYVAVASRGGVIDSDKLAEYIAQDTATRPAQVRSVLEALVENIMTWAEEGHGVRLGDLGTFLPMVKSNSDEDADNVSVKRVRLSFRPSKALTTRLNAVSTSTENSFKSKSAAAGGDEATDDAVQQPSAGAGNKDEEDGVEIV